MAIVSTFTGVPELDSVLTEGLEIVTPANLDAGTPQKKAAFRAAIGAGAQGATPGSIDRPDLAQGVLDDIDGSAVANQIAFSGTTLVVPDHEGNQTDVEFVGLIRDQMTPEMVAGAANMADPSQPNQQIDYNLLKNKPGTTAAGLTAVSTDATLTGDGTGGDPLKVANPYTGPAFHADDKDHLDFLSNLRVQKSLGTTAVTQGLADAFRTLSFRVPVNLPGRQLHVAIGDANTANIVFRVADLLAKAASSNSDLAAVGNALQYTLDGTTISIGRTGSGYLQIAFADPGRRTIAVTEDVLDFYPFTHPSVGGKVQHDNLALDQQLPNVGRQEGDGITWSDTAGAWVRKAASTFGVTLAKVNELIAAARFKLTSKQTDVFRAFQGDDTWTASTETAIAQNVYTSISAIGNSPSTASFQSSFTTSPRRTNVFMLARVGGADRERAAAGNLRLWSNEGRSGHAFDDSSPSYSESWTLIPDAADTNNDYYAVPLADLVAGDAYFVQYFTEMELLPAKVSNAVPVPNDPGDNGKFYQADNGRGSWQWAQGTLYQVSSQAILDAITPRDNDSIVIVTADFGSHKKDDVLHTVNGVWSRLGSLSPYRHEVLTQAAYDALAVKDSNTLYFTT